MVADALFLIDSTFLFRASESAFLGAPLLVDRNARDRTRTFGVVRDILRLRKLFGMRRAAVVVGEESLLATTDAVVDDLLSLLRQINASVLRDDGARVVDICAPMASSARWIVSTNRSIQQLVTKNLGVLIPREGEDAEVVTIDSLSDTGMRPHFVPAVLALSDGKDAPLKFKQAVRLLEIYGSLEAVLSDALSAPPANWKRKLAPNSHSLLQAEAALRVRPTTSTASLMSISGTFVEDSDQSASALKACGFWSLVRMLPLPDARGIGVAPLSECKTDYRAVRNVADMCFLEKCLSQAEICAIDTETSGKDPRCATLYGVALAVAEGQAFYVPMMQSDLDGLSPEVVRDRLNAALTRKLKLVGHNLKYDLAVLRRSGIDVQEIHFDTMLAAHECFGDWEFWNLSALAKKLLGASVKRYRDIVGDGETFLDRPFKELVEHACCDADMAFRLHAVLTKELRKRHAEQDFLEGPMRVERLLIERERDDVRVDIRRMRTVGKAVKASTEALRAVVVASAGCEFDIDSPKGTTEVLRKLGIWEKTTRPLSESQMEQIAGDFPLVASIVKYRRERRRHKEVEAICDAVKKGRVYPLFSQSKSAHGSLSSASPNLDEAIRAGAVLDRVIVGLSANESASIQILMEASGDAGLRKDLKARGGKNGFIPGFSVLGEAEQGEALLMTAIGEPDPVVSRRFLVGRADAAKLRSAITSRYQTLFLWLQEFKRASFANGFAEHGGKRKYLAGLRSSDLDKRNRAIRSAVRWLAKY